MILRRMNISPDLRKVVVVALMMVISPSPKNKNTTV